MNIRQGVIGGVVIAVFSSVSVGNATDSVWTGLITLGFTLLAVAGVTALMVGINRSRGGQ